jgi:cell wall-associated NlpC family hydrolase
MKFKQWISMGILLGISLINIESYASEITKPTQSVVEGILTYTTAENTRVREVRGVDTPILMVLDPGTPVVATAAVGGWYKVEYEGESGYIYNSQLDTSKLAILQEKVQVKKQSKADDLITYAKQFLGNPYRFGGNSLTNGVDCSGFTVQIFRAFGYNLQRSSRAQFANNGYRVNQSDIMPGDLVFYGRSGVVDHVAIYIGDNQIIHANSSTTGIIISRLQYGKPIIGIKRIIQ